MKGFLIQSLVILLLAGSVSCRHKHHVIIVPANNNNRTLFGIEWLSDKLAESGCQVSIGDVEMEGSHNWCILVGLQNDSLVQEKYRELGITAGQAGKEGFMIHSGEHIIVIGGNDHSGTLYGCLELAERVKQHGRLLVELDFADQPEMVIRGTCVGLQKTEYLPGRSVYEYPYTPENFPWFYDKGLWIEYFNLLVENRYNALFLWNGHPFASLVRLDDYPYAVEVDEETFRKNEEMYRFITEEADRRGITVIQMFYNIILSKPFAERHGLKIQDRSRPITPLISDYTRKSVAAFIEKYPNTGLMVALGEAMNTYEDDVKWFTETIIPGIKDGMKSAGRTDKPPLVLRGHDTDPEAVMKAAQPLYKNLYTTHKYNGESLTTYQPRGSWVQIHQKLSALGPVHIANVHILANLEPFRYGSPGFIQKCVVAMHDIQGANGLHLYPQSAYWDWPYSADKTAGRLLQIDRDWIWFAAWGRYAWNCERQRDDEIIYWTKKLGEYYGCDKHGEQILAAYEQMGQIAPKLLRRFGISDGNRQTLLLGMFMSQLVNPYKWNVYSNFYSSNGPEGEILIDYADKEWNHLPHQGETPPRIIKEVVEHAEKAVEAIEKVDPFVKQNREEFSRLKNDVYCYSDIASFFADKVNAAMLVLRYQYSGNLSDLEAALPYLEHSVETYRKLVDRTRDTYLYANSMQTAQRRIPISGQNGKNKTWEELLPFYEDELENFERNLGMLKSAGDQMILKEYPILIPVDVKILDKNIRYFSVSGNDRIYDDRDFVIEQFAPELKNMKGLRFSYEKQREEGTTVRFVNDVPVKVLVGYFNGHSYSILSPPSLEINAAANDRGQVDIRIANALYIPGLYPVNIYTYYYEPGENIVELGPGIALILGFMEGEQEIQIHDAGITGVDGKLPIDWLFY